MGSVRDDWAGIVWDVLKFTAGNIGVNLALRLWMSRAKATKTIPARRRNRAILYIISCINSVISSSYGVHHFLTGGARSATEETLIWRTYTCICFVTGYFLADFIFVLPEAATYPNDVIHHLIGMGLGFGALRNVSSIYKLVPMFSLQELSTLPLNLMWAAKEFDAFRRHINPDHPKAVFFFTFLITRMGLLPAEYFRQWRDGTTVPSTAVHVAMFLFIGLQYYWGYGILRKAGLFRLFGRGRRRTAEEKDGKVPAAGPSSPMSPAVRTAVETIS